MGINYEHDGCLGCKYEHNDAADLPCVTCRQNYLDCWTEKKEADRHLVDRDELIDKLWKVIKDDTNHDMQCGVLQAILVATLMDTAETVERGDVSYGEDI